MAIKKRDEVEVLNAFLSAQGLKRSEQREVILDVFLKAKGHVSVDDLLALVQKKHPEISRATIYRTLRVFQEAGLASELELQGRSRFEADWNREHHDHMICEDCGEIFEFVSPDIERLQEEVASRIGFIIRGHRHHILGQCASCARPKRK